LRACENKKSLVAPPQEENRREAASDTEVRIFSVSLMQMAVRKAKVDGSEKAAGRLMTLGVERRLVEFGGTWFGEVVVYPLHSKTEKHDISPPFGWILTVPT
jgi:hypothetical protein